MRVGGCTVQQALTSEAATIVKVAVSLARRRGHAQVTPVHVATAMLSSSTGLLRAACLRSHSHPLQCKALELCFNVALNRLPAFSPLIMGPHPALSNAIVAAFKRAQAYQRRGSVETQQQPLLAVKIELDQFIISILDDPSVSRVMRESGFSSTQVKSNVETCPTNYCSTSPTKIEDVVSVMETMVSKRKRSVVVVGEFLSTSEGVLRGLMERVQKGEVHQELRGVEFINFSLSSLGLMSREEVDLKVGELRCVVRRCSMGRGAVLYLGDLEWAVEYWDSCGEKENNFYFPIENLMREIGKLVNAGGSRRFWLMGVATYQTYMKCRRGNPSLETLWTLQPLAVPSGCLDLTINLESDLESQLRYKKRRGGGCFDDFSFKFENDGQLLEINMPASNHGSLTSNLPSWLRKQKEDQQGAASNDQDCCIQLDNLSKKSTHNSNEKTLHFSLTPSPSSSLHQSHQAWPVPFDTKHSCQHNPNSASSTGTMETKNIFPKFKELNAQNLKTLCHALEEAVPWQLDIIPDIASTILKTRSGMMMTRKDESSKPTRPKEDTWLFFQGGDVEGKEKIASELANLIFGSHTNFVSIGLSTLSSKKRLRDEETSDHSYIERFFDAIRKNPHQVIMMEDIDQVDYYSHKLLKNAMERGLLESLISGEEISVRDAIIILSCERFDSTSRSPPVKQKSPRTEKEGEEEACEKEKSSCMSFLDLNVLAKDEEGERWSLDDVGLLESVDRALLFELPDGL